MAEGMLELTRSLMEISARLDALAGGAGPSRPTFDPGSVIGSAGGVFAVEPVQDPAPGPAATPDPAAGEDLPGRRHPASELRPRADD
jgi:hypothetical protein